MKLNNKTIDVWNKAKDCGCQESDCDTNHKLCGICSNKIVYTAHKSNQPNSKFAWDIDHIIPLKNGGTDDINNLQISHVVCNSKKN
ncbi:HNH endonuclease signature motif containing protein [Spiroplasma endosymbiont of Dioctria linearis]|uniref:HNH endonuclease n=1 Tax=Spiroplasma endosymbiont of Dioctria linearis TaxID=3066290 RepID=UPI00313E8036